MPGPEGRPSSPSGEPVAAPDPESSGENEREAAEADRGREILLKVEILGVLGGVTVLCALCLSSCHPAVEASVEARLPAPGKPVKLSGATTARPISAELESFGVGWITPEGKPPVPGRGERIEIEFRVSVRDCAQLEAEIGGGCGGVARGPRRVPEQLAIEARRPFTIRVTASRMPALELGQTDEATDQAPPSEWSLTENASNSHAQIECPQRVEMTVSLAPGEAEATCSLTGTVYRLLTTNERPYAPSLSFDQLSDFTANRLAAERARIDLDQGQFSVDGVETTLSGPQSSGIALRAGGSELLRLAIATPAEESVGDLSLRAAHTAEAYLDGRDQVPSLLHHAERPIYLWVGLLVGMTLDSLIDFVLTRRKARR